MHFAAFAATLLAVAAPGEVSSSDAKNAAATVLLDFRADWCGPCRQMDPVVGSLAAEGMPVRKVNIDQERALADKFGVQGIPCFVMLVNGKEVDRVVGATDRGRLEAMFSRNGVGPVVNAARAQSPVRNAIAKTVPFPATDRRGAGEHNSDSENEIAPPRLARNNPPRESHPMPSTGAEAMHDKLIRASVRLKIEDDKGNSCGSGTIIDAREGEALIITCGHVFRDAVKGGQILVDLFGPNAPTAVPGHLIDYDLKSEVGLIRIETNYPVAVARMAPAEFKLRKGDDVISIGCDGGADATVKETKVTSVNRYSGAANVEVAFQPVQGRSGGGLFTPDGLVVGVCYAADPEANEGLFAALPALCAELDRNDLSFIYRNSVNAAKLQDIGNRRAVARGAERSDVANILKTQATGADRPRADAANSSRPLASSKADELSEERLPANERAALEAIRNKSQGAELICILHPAGNPQGKSEIFVLDQVSPNFMRHLAAERSKSSQQLTSLEIPRGDSKTGVGQKSAMVDSRPTGAAPAGNRTLTPPDTSRWWVDLLDRPTAPSRR
jgi:thiol-disulfide isomerase/thioredoxin